MPAHQLEIEKAMVKTPGEADSFSASFFPVHSKGADTFYEASGTRRRLLYIDRLAQAYIITRLVQPGVSSEDIRLRSPGWGGQFSGRTFEVRYSGGCVVKITASSTVIQISVHRRARCASSRGESRPGYRCWDGDDASLTGLTISHRLAFSRTHPSRDRRWKQARKVGVADGLSSILKTMACVRAALQHGRNGQTLIRSKESDADGLFD